MHDMLLILTYKVNKCNQNFKKCLDKILFKTEKRTKPELVATGCIQVRNKLGIRYYQPFGVNQPYKPAG